MNMLIIPRQERGKIEKYYDEMAEAYIEAFAGPPWFEKTRCADPRNGCEGGFSALGIDEQCLQCGLCPSTPAYNNTEVVERFKQLADTYQAAWWLEFRDKKLAMAAFAWLATAEQIIAEKYPEVKEMGTWLPNQLDMGQPIMWLDEVFKNPGVRERNLRNFSLMNDQLNEALGGEMIAFRTITPQMLSATRRLGNKATIFTRRMQVPDRRDFVIIKKGKK